MPSDHGISTSASATAADHPTSIFLLDPFLGRLTTGLLAFAPTALLRFAVAAFIALAAAALATLAGAA